MFNISHIPAEADASSFAEEAIGPLGGRYRILIIPEGFGSRLLNGTLETRLLVTRNTLESVLQGDDAPQFGQQDREEILQGAAALDEAIAALDVEEATLILVVDPGDPSGQVIQSILITVSNSFSNRLVGVGENIFIEEESVSQESFTAVDYYLPGLIGAFIMTSSVFGVTSQNTEFRKRGIIKRLSLTPLSRTEWIIGSVLAQTVLAFVLTGVMFAVGWVVLGVRAVPNLIVIGLIIAGAVQFSGLGMLIAGLIKDVESAVAAGNAIVFPMMFLSGAFFPLDVAPAFIRTISNVLPLKYLIDGLRLGLIAGFPEGAIVNLAITSALALAFIFVGSVTMRWHEN